jgi:hypothetical protein
VQKTYFRFSSVWYWATDFFTKGNAGQIVQCASPLQINFVRRGSKEHGDGRRMEMEKKIEMSREMEKKAMRPEFIPRIIQN